MLGFSVSWHPSVIVTGGRVVAVGGRSVIAPGAAHGLMSYPHGVPQNREIYIILGSGVLRLPRSCLKMCCFLSVIFGFTTFYPHGHNIFWVFPIGEKAFHRGVPLFCWWCIRGGSPQGLLTTVAGTCKIFLTSKPKTRALRSLRC